MGLGGKFCGYVYGGWAPFLGEVSIENVFRGSRKRYDM